MYGTVAWMQVSGLWVVRAKKIDRSDGDISGVEVW
jgi:hypothetical protein